jgi:hypothetical protein
VVGGGLAVVVIKVLYPDITPAEAADIMFPRAAGPSPEHSARAESLTVDPR